MSKREKEIAREVRRDLAKTQEALAVPADSRMCISDEAVGEILKIIDKNDATLRFLARV